MEFPHILGRKESPYSDISDSKIEYAREWLRSIESREVRSLNITSEEATGLLKRLEDGTLPVSSVTGFAHNQIEKISKEKEI